MLSLASALFLDLYWFNSVVLICAQPADEWSLEQGLEGGALPLLDQTIDETTEKHNLIAADQKAEIRPESEASKEDKYDKDPYVTFAEEREGWKG